MKSRILITFLAAIIPLLIASQIIEMNIQNKIKEITKFDLKLDNSYHQSLENNQFIRFLEEDSDFQKNSKFNLYQNNIIFQNKIQKNSIFKIKKKK